jgi:tRNA(fMet)-specific endonuclease VapC
MPTYMLDTDTVSFALRGQGRVAARLLEHRPSELCISSIALAELRYGAEARRSRKLHRLISTFVEPIAVMSFDQSAAGRLPGSQPHWRAAASRSALSTPS